MNKVELYREILHLTPYNGGNKEDYRKTLKEAVNKYKHLVDELNENDRPAGWDNLKNTVSKIISKINDIALNSYKGLPSTAGTQLSNLIKENQKSILYRTLGVNSVFYRMRTFEDRRTNISHTEMFHIPMEMRRKVSTQRYSTPGYPCLYLGMSVYTCWEEMNRPRMSDCWVSRLNNINKIRLLDLSVPELDYFIANFESYLKIYPIIISCMLPVENSKDIYKPEYIIPQLITEWIIKNDMVGIYYTSVHKSNGFDFPMSKYQNIAIPVKTPLKQKGYCDILSPLFEITAPINLEIEHLRNENQIDWEEFGLDELQQQEENYHNSAFGHLEEWLGAAGLRTL